ncbi:MAG: tRNA (adenosine(37)-N6)-threonylcarbamoyltransferase complex ATPase subunit type 1 TsaE [Treponema sp.]|nr:tRNA (adenosine(37)-N6)-threonylcarbamoyltransferase complex ATPase subunit type 1 TsaE [Treponema sp.]
MKNSTEAEDFLFEIVSSSAEETLAAGEKIGKRLHKGSIVALEGGLGAGKTQLTKGIALGLGIHEEITSPTYTIISEYDGSIPLFHIDTYRLKGSDDFINIGAEELLYGNGVCVIEWSNIVADMLPEKKVSVKIKILDDGKRLICVDGMNLEG